MKIVIAYSHKDADAARRLLCWLKFLGGVPVPLLVVATVRASRFLINGEIRDLVHSEFANSEHWVLPDEDERGWPRSSTHIFTRALAHANDDIFWLEPDVVPLREGWFEALLKEWEAAGTTFVGRFVPKGKQNPDHMTGVAFYGKNWKSVVPNLCTINEKGTGAWDVDRAPEILKNFTPTKLIQHRWVRDQADQRVPISSIESDAVVYHQCKSGTLMHALRPEFKNAPLTQKCYPVTTSNPAMSKFYQTQNAAKAVEVDGRKFTFEPAEYFSPSASWWGTLKAETPEDAAALDVAVSRGLAEEITEEDYDKMEVKKNRPQRASNSIGLPNFHGLSEAPKRPVEPAATVEKPALENFAAVLAPKPATARAAKAK